jgi:uncharacterized protein YcfL
MRGIYWLTGLALLWAVGCSASTHPVNVHDHQDPYHGKTRLQWNSSNLKSVLQVEMADADRITGGLLRVRLVLRNKTKEDIFVDVRAVFTDEKGFEKEKTNWEAVCCTARTQTTYQVVSLGSQVNDFQIIIRDPKTSPEE